MADRRTIGFMLSTTGRKISQYLTVRFQPFDVTSEQFTVLNRLAEQDGISQKELSVRAEKDPTNVTRILDQLERKGLVRREMNPGDRRSFLTYITEAGRSLNEKLTPIETEVIEKVLKDLSEAEIEKFQIILSQINHNIENE
ncbi:MarR family winged helix-turn-helix transcriptional regulator [Brevibacillus fulvus]|uniref:DNA-binding MarR family transcriptional regulator n=1 Tax=Brevibacillus fulvus TaxID=1125967 RepID=A0A939BVF0_9BACL|nr:MarR family transcriptional regulator [Brevibacillus fulvus]MBM7591409.1 DNA-binding MarR family transcriptional regulator [Brevibacillus fulvus]